MHEGRDRQITMERVKTTGRIRASAMQRQLKDKKSVLPRRAKMRKERKSPLMSEFWAKWSLRGDGWGEERGRKEKLKTVDWQEGWCHTVSLQDHMSGSTQSSRVWNVWVSRYPTGSWFSTLALLFPHIHYLANPTHAPWNLLGFWMDKWRPCLF